MTFSSRICRHGSLCHNQQASAFSEKEVYIHNIQVRDCLIILKCGEVIILFTDDSNLDYPAEFTI